jgi:hypothetical protein
MNLHLKNQFTSCPEYKPQNTSCVTRAHPEEIKKKEQLISITHGKGKTNAFFV